jgi:hypothetical protein
LGRRPGLSKAPLSSVQASVSLKTYGQKMDSILGKKSLCFFGTLLYYTRECNHHCPCWNSYLWAAIDQRISNVVFCSSLSCYKQFSTWARHQLAKLETCRRNISLRQGKLPVLAPSLTEIAFCCIVGSRGESCLFQQYGGWGQQHCCSNSQGALAFALQLAH